MISVDLDYGFRLQDLSVQLGIACVGKAARLLQLCIRLGFLAKLRVSQGGKQISLDGKVARGGIDDPWAVEKRDYLRSPALIREDLSFEKSKPQGPIGITGRKIPPGLLCLL